MLRLTVDKSMHPYSININSDYRQESRKAIKHEEKAALELKLRLA